MKKITLLLLFFLTVFSTETWAQELHFEGIVKMHQQTANGVEYDVTWYIKKGQIAFKLSSDAARGTDMRFVPQKESQTMLMVIGDDKKEIPVDQIESELNLTNLSTKVIGGTENNNFKEVFKYEITTDKAISTVEVTTDIPISFSEYAAFFKNDYGIHVLAKSGKKGFPIQSITKDKAGNLITKTTLKSVERINVDESMFK